MSHHSSAPKPLPEPMQGKYFLVSVALKEGVTHDRLRRGDLWAARRGMRAPIDTLLGLEDFAWLLSAQVPHGVISHESAARLWGFPLPQGVDESWELGPGGVPPDVDITVPPHSARPRGVGVRGHQRNVPAGHVGNHLEIRLTTMARTWFDLCSVYGDEDCVVIADHLLRIPRPAFEGRTEPYATIEDLRQVVAESTGRRGLARAKRVLELARVGADSPQETRLRLALVRAGLPEPVLNTVVRGEAGAVPTSGDEHSNGTRGAAGNETGTAPSSGTGTAPSNGNGRTQHTPDMQWPEFHVTAEYDGTPHRDKDQMEKDIDRAEFIRRIGWREIRVSSKDAKNDWGPAIDRIRDALAEAGWRP
jgi:hypothetical protein